MTTSELKMDPSRTFCTILVQLGSSIRRIRPTWVEPGKRMIGITRRILDSMLLNAAGRSLTHDVLNTLMAEVSAIVNSRPLVPIILGNSINEIYVLPNGDEYRLLPVFSGPVGGKEYLPLLQQRRKWTEDRRDLIEGDVILLKDKNICRTQWPVGIIVNSFKSSDEHVRKAEVRVIVNGKATTYTRPIVDMILLIENNPV
ncbi:Hypothetical predicted protein [Mytilus galloprovincialis]|uniref:DUF5641 domain-containing protein n=1 Tax=Mytilus galloprovincialis TaxID=29158 RepID=A0A8B6DTI9_MYTGA|nr:Hypothetical predicted protein [Mytilus galloprovincialis]